jgi:uncharacterized membrane protein
MDRTTRLLATLFTVSGILHFAMPKPFEKIIPTPLKPYKRELVQVSGVAELGCAALMAAPKTRRLGGLLSFGVLAGVFPANIQMTVAAFEKEDAPAWYRLVTLARLPLQLPMLMWARKAWMGRG